MATAKIFFMVSFFSSCLCIESAVTSNFFIHFNNSKIWMNNKQSLHQKVFLDGSMARFILPKHIHFPTRLYNHIEAGFCFYCDSSAAKKCQLSIVFIEFSNGTLSERPPLVIWSANRGRPVQGNATLQLLNDGNMILADVTGQIVWSAHTAGKFVSGMRIKAHGNLVLFNHSSGIVWQSFHYPTDTLVSQQKMAKGKNLTSSNGLFYLAVYQNSLTAFVEGKIPTKYLSIGGGPPVIPAVESLDLRYVRYKEGKLTFFFQQLGNNTPRFSFQTPKIADKQILRLDDDGGLRIYAWEPRAGWNAIYVFLDGWDECQFPLKCGKYGVCQNGQCTCPVGADGHSYFNAVDSHFPNLGCRELVSSTFHASSAGEYELLNFGNLSYFSFFDDDAAVPGIRNEENCKQACLDEVSCRAAFFKHDYVSSQNYCHLTSEILSLIALPQPTFGYYTSSFIKVSTHAVAPQFHPREGIYILPFFSCILFVIFVSILCLLAMLYLRRTQNHIVGLTDFPLKFPYWELCLATGRFTQELGSGGFGTVFKGVLRDGTNVAVKQLENIGQGMEEFFAEVQTMGSIHHLNLVRLIGFCFEKRRRMLVYEYMSNGSLDKWIFAKDQNATLLDWKTRKKILLDIAKGLTYLHEECRQKIVHLDVKPHNILLDSNFNAKLSDFGMSKLINRDESRVVTRVRGTLGYLAPEWEAARITEKADIYSFGIVLLEVVSGRKNLDYSEPHSVAHLLSVLQNKVLGDQLMDIVDNRSEDMQNNISEAVEVVKLGMWCLNIDYTRRPPMSLVAKILEGIVELPADISFNFPCYVMHAKQTTVSAAS